MRGPSGFPYPRNAAQVVETDGRRLPQVHRTMLFASRNTKQPVTVAKVFIRQAAFLRAKQESHSPAGKLLADEPGALFEPRERVLQFAPGGCRRTYHEHAVGHGIGDASKLSRIEKDLRCADARPCLAKRGFERFHDAEIGEAEVA